MTRYRFGARFSLRDAAVPGRVGAHQARPARQRKRHFQFERLEDRLVMDGDSTLVADATADDAAVVSLPGMNAANDVPAMPVVDISEQFQSAAELEAWLIEAATAQYGHLFGQSTRYGYPYIWYGDFDLGGPIVWRANDAIGNGMLLAGNTSSTTSVQVAGVDEADLIETDGEYLYILSGNELVIVEAGVGEDLRELSRIRISGDPIGMYLDGDRLAIVSGESAITYSPSFLQLTDVYNPGNNYSPTQAVVTVLDVSDRSAPILVQKSEMDGRVVASRVVNGELRLVLSNAINLPPPIAKLRNGAGTASPVSESSNPFNSRLVLRPIDTVLWNTNDFDTNVWYPPSSTEYVYETQEEYLARVKEEILKSVTPGVRLIGIDGEVISEELLFEATELYRPDSINERSITSIASFDLSSNVAGPADTESFFAAGATLVYSTAESLYVFSDNWGRGAIYAAKTAIRKFDFNRDTHEIKLSARGELDGQLLNQFSADENEGYLRVVAKEHDWTTGQSLYVFEQIGKRLEVVGSVEDIAPTEQLYSVRFMGDRAFLVTFRQVDPLFALDLSDPTDPKILGELKIPGYSDYLQPIDENHLLAIGRGADEATGWFQELQVSIFNIADLENPQLAHRYSFDGGRAITSPATGDRWQRGDGDHHAVSYFAEAGVFALPIANSDGDWWWGDDDAESSGLASGESGLQVFQIDVVAGFTPIGLIQHETEIERSLRIGEHLYAISSGRVSVHELTDPTNELGSLSIVGVSPPLYTRLTMKEVETARVATTFVGPIAIEPVESAAKAIPTIEPDFEPYRGPFVGPMPEGTVFEAAMDVTVAAVMSTVAAPFAALVEDSAAAVVLRTASDAALPFQLPEATHSRSALRVQRLARLDAFESFDNSLLLADSADELANSQARVSRSIADEVLGSDDTESSDGDTLGASLAAPWSERPQLDSVF